VANKQSCVETARSVVLVATACNVRFSFVCSLCQNMKNVLTGHAIRIHCTDCLSGVGTEAITDTRVEG